MTWALCSMWVFVVLLFFGILRLFKDEEYGAMASASWNIWLMEGNDRW